MCETNYLGGRWFAKNNSGDTVLTLAYEKGTLRKMVEILRERSAIFGFNPKSVNLTFCSHETLNDRDKQEFESLLNSMGNEDADVYDFLIFLNNLLRSS